MRLKFEMLLKPQLYDISEMEWVVSINFLDACPSLISLSVSIKVLPVLFLMKRLKDTSVILTSLATSQSDTDRSKLEFMN